MADSTAAVEPSLFEIIGLSRGSESTLQSPQRLFLRDVKHGLMRETH